MEKKYFIHFIDDEEYESYEFGENSVYQTIFFSKNKLTPQPTKNQMEPDKFKMVTKIGDSSQKNSSRSKEEKDSARSILTEKTAQVNTEHRQIVQQELKAKSSSGK